MLDTLDILLLVLKLLTDRCSNSLRALSGLVCLVLAPRLILALNSSGCSLLTSGFFSGVLIFQTTIGDGGQESEAAG